MRKNILAVFTIFSACMAFCAKAKMPEWITVPSSVYPSNLYFNGTGNGESREVAELEAVKNLSTLLDGYSVFPVAAKKEAAQKLKAVFDKYRKSITTANYVSESSLIESLLEDFSKEEETVSLLDGIKEILEQIRSAQDLFAKASDEYNAASTVKTESASSLKKPLLSAINDKLIPYITAMQMANSAVYADFATKAEGEIKRVNETVSRRSK